MMKWAVLSSNHGCFSMTMVFLSLIQDLRTVTAVHGITPGVVVILDKADEHATNSAAVDGQIRNVDFQLVTGQIVGIRRVKRELGVQDHVVLRLVVLELDGACSEVISCRIELNRFEITSVLVKDAGAEDLRRFHIVAASMGKGDRGAVPVGVALNDDVGLSKPGRGCRRR